MKDRGEKDVICIEYTTCLQSLNNTCSKAIGTVKLKVDYDLFNNNDIR